jgi:AcrR family transcriptional regulator
MRLKTKQKEQHILDIAAQAFRELGYEGASMAEICVRVGGSKATLYNYFSSKEELFFRVLKRSTEEEFNAARSVLDASKENIADALLEYGDRFLTVLYSPEVRANRHLVIANSGKTDLGRVMHEQGVKQGHAVVANFLAAAMAQGRLKSADPLVATKHLHALLEAEILELFLFQIMKELSAAEIHEYAKRALEVFMSAYGPK